MAKFVVYESDDEVIVMSKKKEYKLIRDYFFNNYLEDFPSDFSGDRDINDYERHESNDVVISTNIRTVIS